MAEKTKRTKLANRKNLLYALWVIALVAVMATAIIVVASVTENGSNMIDNGGTSVSQSEQNGSSNSQPEEPEQPEQPEEPDPGDDEGNIPNEPEEPVSGKVSFIMPCEGASVIKSYTENTLVFNSTLGAYMGHMGIDFAASEGAEVVCVYDGVIESITTSYLTGTTIIVNHGNDLKTVYNSIDANEALYEGATVKQGAVLGYVSANNLQEYKDGPHLHFEVIKGGDKINPNDYLIGDEK